MKKYTVSLVLTLLLAAPFGDAKTAAAPAARATLDRLASTSRWRTNSCAGSEVTAWQAS